MIENVRLLTRVEVEKQRKLNQFLQGCVLVPDVHPRALATIERMTAALKEAYGMLEFHDSLGCENDTCALCLFLFKVRPELIDPNETRSRLVAKAKANPITIIREYEGGSDVG